MNACIFILTINAMMPVYGSDRTTAIAELNIGDKVCVLTVEPGDWMQVHWSNGNAGRTGFLHEISVAKPGEATEPAPYEQQEQLAPPPPPAPLPAPDIMPKQERSYQQPNLDSPVLRPTALAMQCFPEHSQPYAVVYLHGQSGISTKAGKPHYHEVLEETDNTNNHVFYVKAAGSGGHTLFYAFDYSQRGDDVSAIRVMGPGYDAKDKCFMDWNNTR